MKDIKPRYTKFKLESKQDKFEVIYDVLDRVIGEDKNFRITTIDIYELTNVSKEISFKVDKNNEIKFIFYLEKTKEAGVFNINAEDLILKLHIDNKPIILESFSNEINLWIPKTKENIELSDFLKTHNSYDIRFSFNNSNCNNIELQFTKEE